jgi:TonB family protein
MAFFSDPRETSGRYGGYIAEFQEFFGNHEVKFGQPADFLQLAPRLAKDEKFRRDFATLTKSVGQREAGHLTLTRMLTIITIALSGPELEKLEKYAVSISLLTVFLAGIGGWCEAEPQAVVAQVQPPVKVETLIVEAPVVTVETPVAKLDETGGWGAIVAALNDRSENEEEEKEALELEQRLSAGPRSDQEESTTSLFGGTALVKEALGRLELNALELKLHLDSIDHRMERIEPHLDDLTARISLTTESLPRVEMNGWAKTLPMQRFSLANVEEQQAGAQQEVVAQEAVTPEVGVVEPEVVLTPGKTKQSRRFYWVVAALGVLLLAGLASMFVYRHYAGKSVESRIAGAAGVANQPDAAHDLDPPGGNGAVVQGVVARQPNQAKGSRQMERQRELEVAGQGGQVRGLNRNGPNQAGPDKTGPIQIGIPVRQEPEIRTEFGNQQGEIHVAKEASPPAAVANNVHVAAGLPIALATARMPSVGRLTAPDANAPVTAAKSAAGNSGSGSTTNATVSKAVFVPASALSHNLIASPKPSYPQIAHFQRTEGDVLVRTVISEKGTVESVTVVSGPAPLRQAAVDAMKSWRYKPYLLDGRPVEVQTYIDFHFSLER